MWADEVPEADVAAAVAASTSWRGVLRLLGKTSPRHGRRLRHRCDEAGISYAHFRGTSSRCVAPDDLEAAVRGAATWGEAAVGVGYSADSGSARASVRRQAEALGLEVGHVGSRLAPRRPGAFSGTTSGLSLRRAAPLLVAARCTLLGHDVAWPLEPKPYDLLVDTAQEGLLRVQVKSGTRFVDGSWIVWIRKTRGGRASGYTPDEIDYFGIVTGDAEVYMLPVALVAGRTSVCLRRYETYRLSA